MKTVTKNVLTVQIGEIVYFPGRVDAKTFRKLKEIPLSSPVPQFYRKWKGETLFFPTPLGFEDWIIREHRETYEL
jgi:hypothetical protein